MSAVKVAMPSLLFELAEIAYGAVAFARTLWEIKRFKPAFIYDRYITFNAGPVLAGKLSRVPVLLEVNAPLALERAEQSDEKLRLRGVARSMERWICAHARKTLVVSTPLREYLRSIGVPAERCVVMPNGADPRRFAPQPKRVHLMRGLGIDPSAFVIGFAGVLRAWHGLDLLLDAFTELARSGRNVFLLIVGDGNYRTVLQKLISERGIGSAVAITGRVPHESVAGYLSLFDAAVSPRATFYASPMKVLEYMALGKPVVVPNSANFLDIVDDDENGLTFREDDAAALAAALARLHDSADLRATLGARAREKIEQRLNWHWNARAACDLIAEGREADCGGTPRRLADG